MENIILKKLLNNESLTEDERTECVFGYAFEEEVGDQGRWMTDIRSIFELGGKTWAIDWSRGNTEYQDNEFYDDPFEVEKFEEVITITKYRPVKN